ncbi:MAG: serine/threonine-protein kinase [Vicinamibacterales bacterium]
MESPLGAFSPKVTSSSDSDSFNHGRFAPGTRIGDRYRIVGRLGVGGMGEVYRADDLKLGQPVALKFLPEAVERDPVRLEKLTAEIRTARQISHPNVCRVYDVGEVDGRRFLTMEYVDGDDLSGLLRRIGRLPEDKGLEIARQICAGLAAIHDCGVLHRDLKPANVMLDGRGRVRLTDFGLATTAAAAAREGEIAGTPAYMAPEQLAGEPLTVATDLYALGLLLFEVFTGERVHKTDRLEDVRAGKRPSAGSVSVTTSGSGVKLDPVIQRVIERCLDADPKRRPQSAIVIAAALPGGDPLAAALAAGETPSPQMVAAAGSEGGLSFKVAVPLLVALLVGVGLWVSLRGHTALAPMIAVTIPPEALTLKASEMLLRLGYLENGAHSAAGFSADATDYAQWVSKRDSSATRWQHVGSVRPALFYFWRRTSPGVMTADRFFGNRPGSGLAVTAADPPLTTPGMTYLQLDPQGRMIWFRAVPPLKRTESLADPTPDWPAIFREAGLDITGFRPVEPAWTTPHDSDVRGGWIGPGADPTGAELRVEAATLGKRLVSFRMLGPWVPLDDVVSFNPNGQAVTGYILMGLFLLVPVVATGLAVRSLRLGRSDARGALRLSAVVFGVVFLGSVLGSPLNVGPAFLPVLTVLASWASLSALLTAAFYLVLEPVLRRHSPRILIAWSRLLDGRWRDPLVGRSLLVGCTLSLWHGLANEFMTGRGQNLEQSALLLNTAGWMRSTDAVAEVVRQLGYALGPSLGTVTLFVVLRIVLRRELAAQVVMFVLFAGLQMLVPGDFSLAKVIGSLLGASILVLVSTRFGLVAFVAFNFTGPLMFMAQGMATPEFATGALLLTMVGAMAPGLFGFYTATRGRKASAWLDG